MADEVKLSNVEALFHKLENRFADSICDFLHSRYGSQVVEGFRVVTPVHSDDVVVAAAHVS